MESKGFESPVEVDLMMIVGFIYFLYLKLLNILILLIFDNKEFCFWCLVAEPADFISENEIKEKSKLSVI